LIAGGGRYKLGLIPKDVRFFELFERDAANVYQGAIELEEMLEHPDEFEERLKSITNLEHEGDIITHEIMDRLNRTFVTPIDREDIHALAGGLDDILDYIEATADRMHLYKINIPTPEVKELASILTQAVEQISLAIKDLRDLRRARRIMDRGIEINRLENEGDRISRAALARIFDECVDPVDAIKWKEIYEHIETAIDKCEDIANVMETVVVKHA
jgi:predicted phosphate transport protein (TIGR00153 family)